MKILNKGDYFRFGLSKYLILEVYHDGTAKCEDVHTKEIEIKDKAFFDSMNLEVQDAQKKFEEDYYNRYV